MRLTKARIQDLERVKKGVYQALDFVVKPNRRSNCDDLPVDMSRTSAFLVGTVVYFSMPVISRFLGIVIMMHYRDHAPPHFHASYGEWEASFAIMTGEILAGKLPGRVLGLVQEWRELHVADLQEAWELAMERKPLHMIEPLV